MVDEGYRVRAHFSFAGETELYLDGFDQRKHARINPYKIIGLLTIILTSVVTMFLISLMAPVVIKVVLAAALALA